MSDKRLNRTRKLSLPSGGDPRDRSSAGWLTEDMLGPGLVLKNGRIVPNFSPESPLDTDERGEIILRTSNGVVTAPGSPMSLQAQAADTSVQVTKKGLRARPSPSQIPGLDAHITGVATPIAEELIAAIPSPAPFAGAGTGDGPVADPGGAPAGLYLDDSGGFSDPTAGLGTASLNDTGDFVAAAATTIARLTGDVTTTSASAGDVTGLSFSIGANEVWQFEAHLMTKCSTANGHKWAVNVPASAAVTASLRGSRASTASIISDDIVADDTLSAAVGTGTYATGGWVDIVGIVANSTTAGSVQIRFASATGGDTTTAKAQSYVTARRIA